jgi:hypothetical protein
MQQGPPSQPARQPATHLIFGISAGDMVSFDCPFLIDMLQYLQLIRHQQMLPKPSDLAKADLTHPRLLRYYNASRRFRLPKSGTLTGGFTQRLIIWLLWVKQGKSHNI